MTEATQVMTLTEFLLARIAEDENIARQAGHGCGYLHEHNAGWVEIELPDEHNSRPSYEARFIRINSPARVLAECEAKRRIVARYVALMGYAARPYSDGDEVDRVRAFRTDTLVIVLEDLAAVYSGHPDYRQEWKS